jgi:cysteine desulfurase
LGKLPSAGLGDCGFVIGSAHKFGGPRGVGFLICPSGLKFEPLIHGGPQEDGRRAGTENVPGVLAMMAALEYREAALTRGQQRTSETWRDAFEVDLTRTIDRVGIIGSGNARLWNTLAVIMPEKDCRQRWVVKLDKLGFAVSTGSACSSGKEAPSHVLTAMGYAAEAGRALRFSAGWETTELDWKRLLTAVKKLKAR